MRVYPPCLLDTDILSELLSGQFLSKNLPSPFFIKLTVGHFFAGQG